MLTTLFIALMAAFVASGIILVAANTYVFNVSQVAYKKKLYWVDATTSGLRYEYQGWYANQVRSLLTVCTVVMVVLFTASLFPIGYWIWKISNLVLITPSELSPGSYDLDQVYDFKGLRFFLAMEAAFIIVLAAIVIAINGLWAFVVGSRVK